MTGRGVSAVFTRTVAFFMKRYRELRSHEFEYLDQRVEEVVRPVTQSIEACEDRCSAADATGRCSPCRAAPFRNCAIPTVDGTLDEIANGVTIH